MKKIKNMNYREIIRELFKANGYEERYGLDYYGYGEEVEPKPYDDYYSKISFGSNEGIYIDFYVLREGAEERACIGTAKTLDESNEEYIRMHELAAKVCLKLRMVVY